MKKLMSLLFIFGAITSAFGLSKDAAVVSKGNQTIGKGLMSSALIKEGKKKNVLVSPLSVYTAFSMLANGSADQRKNKTFIELAGLLNVTSHSQLNSGLLELINDLKKQDVVEFSLANSIYTNSDNFLPKKNYIEGLKSMYDADVEFRSFKPADLLVSDINSWVSKQTKEKIKKVLKIDDVTPDSVFFLLNALYLKGDWIGGFKKSRANSRSFTLLDGKKTSPEFMEIGYIGQYLPYAKGAGYEVISLPLGKSGYPLTQEQRENNTRFKVDIILPSQSEDPAKFWESLDLEAHQNVLENAKREKINLVMPKFEIGYTMDLKETLLGAPFNLKEVFDAHSANLKDIGVGINGENIYVGMARHKTYAKVDEKGFEGAAVTVIGGMRSTSLPRPGREIVVDRPFMFVVRDAQNGNLPIFIGSVVNPSDKN